VFSLESKKGRIYLYPDLWFWTKLIAYGDHTEKCERFLYFT